MHRLLFEKTGKAVWISHLDLMRLFQRAFKRAGLPLTHTQGYNPRPSVSIALPLSVGIESCCELLDFELDGVQVSDKDILTRLNRALVDGVRVLEVYQDGKKIKHLSYLRCCIALNYDQDIPDFAESEIKALFTNAELIVSKKSKNGVQDINTCPMIQSFEVSRDGDRHIIIEATVCCQNPSLNPALLVSAVEKYLPHLKPDFSTCKRCEIYDNDHVVFR